MNRTRCLFLFVGAAAAISLLLLRQFRTSGELSTQATLPAVPPAVTPLARQCVDVLQTTYGVAPAGDLLRALAETGGGAEAQVVFQAMALRKAALLPLVKERLRIGEMFEKFMLTKFLRYCPWPETLPELVALARDKSQYWMPRQGALYALGALGDRKAGPDVAEILREPNCPAGVQLASISALARMQYREGVQVIRPFAQDADVHLKLFAARALAEFGEPVDAAFLSASLQDADYIVRQEACGALGAAGITEQLQWIAGNDPHEAVRAAAAQALLEHTIRAQPVASKVAILRGALPDAEPRTATWIIRSLLEQGGREGHAAVEELAARDGQLGERSRAYLILEAAK